MIKQMEQFSRQFPAKLLKDKSIKPFASKFKRNFESLSAKCKPILRQARQLEKMGDKKSKRQLDVFAVKFRVTNKM